MKILQSKEPVKLSYFQSKLCVSKNTISKEFEMIEKWLNKRELKVIRKSRLGIIVDGSEKNKRNAIREITSETISTEDIVNYVKKGTASQLMEMFMNREDLKSIFKAKTTDEIINIINKYSNK